MSTRWKPRKLKIISIIAADELARRERKGDERENGDERSLSFIQAAQ